MPTTSTKAIAKNSLDKTADDNPGIKLNRDAEKKFYSLCELADIIDEEFGSDKIRIGVDDSGTYGVISVDTDEVVFENGRSHQFFEYLKFADFLSFSKTKSGLLRIQFGVKNLWVRA